MTISTVKSSQNSAGKQVSEAALQQQIEQLSLTMTPKQDLWQGIEHAIQTQVIKSKQATDTHVTDNNAIKAPMAWAASIVLAVLVSWFAFSPNGGLGLQQGDDVFVQMQQSFEQQKQLMLVSYGGVSSHDFSPAMQVQLAQLRAARQSIEKLLVNDKRNADLLNLLSFTQQQELTLLQQLYRTLSITKPVTTDKLQTI